MNSKLVKLLAFICAGLGLALVGEWLFVSYSQHSLLASIGSEKLHDYKSDQLPGIDLGKQSEEDYADLVARPLFIKGRKPVDEPVPETAQAQAAAQSDSFDWQLTGIYSTKKNLSALFGRSKSKVAKDNNRKLTVGEDIDGWKLTDINKDRVVLKQGGAEKELPLRKPKLKTLPRANSAAPATAAPFPIPTPNQAPAPVAMPEPGADAPEDIPEDTTEGTPEDEP